MSLPFVVRRVFASGNYRRRIVKAALRGDEIEAVNWYFNFVLRPLIEVLRMKHCPARYDFSYRYTALDLPPDVVATLRELHRVNGCKDVRAKVATARKLFSETVEALPMPTSDWPDRTSS